MTNLINDVFFAVFMSQIEQNFRVFLSKNPGIKKCYSKGLINRRSLARHLIREGVSRTNQLEATIAMIRRFDFAQDKREKDAYRDVKINIKDKIIILEYEKEKELMYKLDSVIAQTNYDKGDTLKIVIGTAAIKLFIDSNNEEEVRVALKKFKLKNRFTDISELSLMFSDKATTSKGILAVLANELFMNDISINELLTGAPELLIYLEDKYVLKTYETIKRLKEY